ncbi:hypothetical protein GGI23_006908, partial [Coemansia sp. RSA 2559]
MFRPVRYHQPQAVPIAVSSPSHMYPEHHALRTRQPERHANHPLPSPLVLPPLVHWGDRAKDLDCRASGHQDLASPHSPSSACYSSGTSMVSAKSPSLSYASSKTASPAPLSALAAAAAVSSPSFDSPSVCADATQAGQEQIRQPAKRRRGGRGARSVYTAEEKEVRRKISHSAIEKRR